MKLPPPRRLGLPAKFRKWREGQSRSVLRIIDSKKRFFALVAPTGSGKSLTYSAVAKLIGGRTVILTATNTLLTQLHADFPFAMVRGQSNYPCPISPPDTVDLGPCHAGVACDLKRGGCPYYDADKKARSSEVTITNYAWWLSQHQYGKPFPSVDTLILDEAHAAPDELANFLSCEVSRESVRRFLDGYAPPEKGERWIHWAKERCIALESRIERAKYAARSDRNKRRDLRTMMNLYLKLFRLSTAKPNDWVLERSKYGWRFDPTWPAPYAELLFQHAPKVIFVSATIRPKTLTLLGLRSKQYEFRETPSTFPRERRPVIHFTGEPRVALTFRSSDGVLRLWVARIDNLIRRRLDRKGIIHCVSYARRDYLLRHSRFSHLMQTHDSGEQAPAVQRFKDSRPPAIFISPSATTGLDFPYSTCEYQIIAKVPFPDLRSKILKARAKKDTEYPFYLAMLDVVQAAGRGMRAADDQCETFIVDDNWGWFARRYKHFAPAWFWEAVRRTDRILDPPLKLKVPA